MRPPICEICGREADETVAFADYESPDPHGPTGHPPGLGWFCRRHLEAARAMQGVPLDEVVRAFGRHQRALRLMALGLFIAVSAALAILGHYLQGGRWLLYVFKPLTTASIIALAAWPRPLTYPRYRTPILVGLVFSLFGDVFLMLPGDLFLPGLVSFAVTHVCYLLAFRSDIAWAPRWPHFALFGAFALALLAALWPGVDPALRLPVVLYAALLAAMVAQATGRAAALGRHSAWLAAAGAVLFMGSDSLLALDRFRFPFEASRAVVLSTYFTAQWLVAMSVERYHSE